MNARADQIRLIHRAELARRKRNDAAALILACAGAWLVLWLALQAAAVTLAC